MWRGVANASLRGTASHLAPRIGLPAMAARSCLYPASTAGMPRSLATNVTSGSREGSSAKGFGRLTNILATGGQGVSRPIEDRPHTRTAGGASRRSMSGVLAIQHTWNNTMVNISDIDYQTKGWVSAGTPPPLTCIRTPRSASTTTPTHAHKRARSHTHTHARTHASITPSAQPHSKNMKNPLSVIGPTHHYPHPHTHCWHACACLPYTLVFLPACIPAH